MNTPLSAWVSCFDMLTCQHPLRTACPSWPHLCKITRHPDLPSIFPYELLGNITREYPFSSVLLSLKLLLYLVKHKHPIVQAAQNSLLFIIFNGLKKCFRCCCTVFLLNKYHVFLCDFWVLVCGVFCLVFFVFPYEHIPVFSFNNFLS